MKNNNMRETQGASIHFLYRDNRLMRSTVEMQLLGNIQAITMISPLITIGILYIGCMCMCCACKRKYIPYKRFIFHLHIIILHYLLAAAFVRFIASPLRGYENSQQYRYQQQQQQQQTASMNSQYVLWPSIIIFCFLYIHKYASLDVHV